MAFADYHTTIAFDLDGTLLDTAPDLIAAVNHVMDLSGGQPVDIALIRPAISLGGREMIKAGLKENGLDHSDAQISKLFPHFMTYYQENIAVLTKPFPGLRSQLKRLAKEKYKLAVCTNKLEDMASQLLTKLELSEQFDAITGRNTFPVHKPDPRHLLATIARAGGDPTRAIMIGDSNTDIQTAKAAGIPVIGVTFGYTDTPITELECDAVISHYNQLPNILDKLIASD